MTSSKLLIALVLAVAVAPSAMAQNRADRAGTWEFVFEANYQDAYRVNFEGGSFAETDDDLGFTIGGTYHLNNRLSFQFLFDWLKPNYFAPLLGSFLGVLIGAAAIALWVASIVVARKVLMVEL